MSVSPSPTRTKSLDVNKYATKKTIAQGLLDVALLTANASQLKYVLQVGEKHEFYTLMLTLISISIILQVLVGILCLSLHLMRDCKLHIEEYHFTAKCFNHLTTIFAFAITVLNLVISCFDPNIARYAIIICCLCVMLGSWLNINKDSHCPRADQFNDVLLCLNVVLVAINVLISSFDMRNSSDTGNVVTNLISNLGNIPGVGGGGGRAAVGVTPAPNATLL